MLLPTAPRPLLVLALAALAAAQSPTVYTPDKRSSPYAYEGCYNETTTLSSSNTRALSGGVSQLGFGNMTVPLCLDYCRRGTAAAYKYAGLQYARECWCAQRLSGLSEEMPDGDCDLPCDGDAGMVCGGDMRLSLYVVESGAALRRAAGWGGMACGLVAVSALL
ncbi:putative fungistatic metabolite like protein [Verticillium longisporum]|uniref:Putative fungistatic metabolite like protein n=1 Tax=Verticillium longisporum TaxID=100787 RepID=A0A8I3AVF7_VERLO|nr:putative fungistatic metabolite like protein [Verticillium longisporum]